MTNPHKQRDHFVHGTTEHPVLHPSQLSVGKQPPEYCTWWRQWVFVRSSLIKTPYRGNVFIANLCEHCIYLPFCHQCHHLTCTLWTLHLSLLLSPVSSFDLHIVNTAFISPFVTSVIIWLAHCEHCIYLSFCHQCHHLTCTLWTLHLSLLLSPVSSFDLHIVNTAFISPFVTSVIIWLAHCLAKYCCFTLQRLPWCPVWENYILYVCILL